MLSFYAAVSLEFSSTVLSDLLISRLDSYKEGGGAF